MTFSVNSNFFNALASNEGATAKRLYINSVDYSDRVQKWPSVKRDWNSIRSATVAIGLENTSQLFNFFHTDKLRLKDAVDIDYGVKYKSHNLLLYSNSLGSVSWSGNRVSELADQIANPVDGTQDVSKVFNGTEVNTTHFYVQSVPRRIVFGGSAAYWLDMYARPDEVKAVEIQINHSTIGPKITFDVESGGVAKTPVRVEEWYSRQSTNGFYKFGFKFFAVSSDNFEVDLFLTNPSSKTQRAYTGNGSDGLYMYGMQFQEADYTDSHQYFMTGGVRQEPWGMNLARYTETFSSSVFWSKDTSVFVTLNTERSPDGTVVADTVQNSNNSISGNIKQVYNLSDAETGQEDYYCASVHAKQGTAANTKLMIRTIQVDSNSNRIGHVITHTWSGDGVVGARLDSSVTSGMSWVSIGSVEILDDGWRRLWCTIKKPLNFLYDSNLKYSRIRANCYPSSSPTSGSAHFWGFQIEKGGKELLDGPGAYIAVHTETQVYPSNAEDMINVFDGTIRDANFSRGKLQLSAKDKFRQLSERIVGTGETPLAINSITPSWLSFVLCSCYGGMSNLQTTANPDIDWASVNTWDSHNTSNTVHVKVNLRGVKITEALRRISRMTRVAIYLEDDKVTFNRFVTVSNQVQALGNESILSSQLSVNDENLVNKQWVFGDWDENSSYYQISLFDEDTASQNSYGLHERVIRDQSIFYPNSGPALDTAQRIISNEANPVDKFLVTAVPSAVRMQIGESISITDPELSVAGTYRIMGSKVDMDRDQITFNLDNSQLLIADAFTLDTSSLGGTDVIL